MIKKARGAFHFVGGVGGNWVEMKGNERLSGENQSTVFTLFD